MIRLATVGTSAITEHMIAAVKESGRFCLQTAFSREPERAAAFAEKHGFHTACSSLPALAQSREIDAVYLASPNVCHPAQSRLFLENGKHVLCEKPIVTESEQFSALHALSQKNGLIYMEAIMSRHSAGHAVLKQALERIGRIALARFDFCQRSSRYDRFLQGKPVNIFDMSLAAGTLMDLGVYCVWAAVDLFGTPQDLSATASFAENGADMAGAAILDYRAFPAILTYAKSGESALRSEIIGDHGTIKLASVSQFTGITLVQNGVETPLLPCTDRIEVMRGEASRFADYIEHPDRTREDYRQVSDLTRQVHRLMDQIKAKADIQYSIKEYVI